MRARAISLALALTIGCANAFAQTFAPPRGIYSLGPATDNTGTPADERLGAIRNYDFVSGYTLRVFWKDVNPSSGVYNFNVIDQALSQLAPLGQRMNLEVLGLEPTWVINGAANTWIDVRGQVNSVPWDTFTQNAYGTFVSALANHVVPDGQNKKLSDHPILASVDAGVPGLSQGVRDINNLLQSQPTYTRTGLLNAITTGVAASRNAFAKHQGFLTMFSMDDGQGPPRFDTTLVGQLAAQYNGPGQPTLAFFTENLSDNGPVKAGALGDNYTAWINDGGEIMFQALTSWVNPFTNPTAVASGNPATGITRGYNDFGAKFFELYVSDLDAAQNGGLDANGRPLLADLQAWDTFLTPEPGCGLVVGACGMLLRRSARLAARKRAG